MRVVFNIMTVNKTWSYVPYIEVVPTILVSSYLAGLEVRYNGSHCLDDRIR